MGDLPVVFSLARYRGSAWWTKYFSRSYGIENENNSESKEGSAIGDFRKDPEIESNSEFKEISAIGDSSKNSTEGSSQVELWRKATIHSNYNIYTWVPSFWTQRFSPDPAGLRLRVI